MHFDLGGNSNSYMSLNTRSKMRNQTPILDMNLRVRPSRKVKLFTFNNTFVAHLILHFTFLGITFRSTFEISVLSFCIEHGSTI